MKTLCRCWDFFIEVFFFGEPEYFLYWLTFVLFVSILPLQAWLFH